MDKFKNCYEKYGFITDNIKTEFMHIMNHDRLKTLCVDIYTLNPYMLFLRNKEKNVSTAIEDGRIIIFKKDKYKTNILNILFDKISKCAIKKYSDIQYEIVFEIHNIYYKLFVAI